MKESFILIALSTLVSFSAFAQKNYSYSNKFSILAGVLQPTALKGGNFEVNYFTKRLSMDYSHGFSLEVPSVGDYKTQNVVFHIPYTTGFGVGYRFNSFLDIRFEPKLHAWQLYHKDDAQTTANKIIDFKTYTLGLGLYYRYFPFRKKENKILQGITTNMSIRWWQNVSTTLMNDEFTYDNKVSGKKETLKAPNIGLANTPLIINFAIGYTFGGK
jgi:hypothetical protein